MGGRQVRGIEERARLGAAARARLRDAYGERWRRANTHAGNDHHRVLERGRRLTTRAVAQARWRTTSSNPRRLRHLSTSATSSLPSHKGITASIHLDPPHPLVACTLRYLLASHARLAHACASALLPVLAQSLLSSRPT